METKDAPTDVLEENIRSATRMVSETMSAMANIYNRQFESGYAFFNDLFTNGPGSKRNKPGVDPDIFRTSMEMFRKNMEDMSTLSKKTMSAFMGTYLGHPERNGEGKKITDMMLSAYNTQIRQIADINQRAYKTLSETIKTTNADLDQIYNDLRENSEVNYRAAEEGIRNAINTYNSVSVKSSKDMQELLGSISKQMDLFARNSMRFWSDLLMAAEKNTTLTKERTRKPKRKSK